MRFIICSTMLNVAFVVSHRKKFKQSQLSISSIDNCVVKCIVNLSLFRNQFLVYLHVQSISLSISNSLSLSICLSVIIVFHSCFAQKQQQKQQKTSCFLSHSSFLLSQFYCCHFLYLFQLYISLAILFSLFLFFCLFHFQKSTGSER